MTRCSCDPEHNCTRYYWHTECQNSTLYRELLDCANVTARGRLIITNHEQIVRDHIACTGYPTQCMHVDRCNGTVQPVENAGQLLLSHTH